MAAIPAAASPSPRAQREAAYLEERALANLAKRTIDGRRLAIRDLERVTQVRPDDLDVQLLLARTYLAAGYLRAATQRFDLVASLSPANAEGHLGLALAWRRDWLHYLDPVSLERAVAELHATVACDSGRGMAWTMLSSLALEASDTTLAVAAADEALALGPQDTDAMLAAAAAHWRAGEPERAEALFREAVPQLPRELRERFDDIAPVVSEADTMVYNHLSARAQAEWRRRFWRRHDPDLATPENEAQLEYWARVVQAYFLYWDAKRREWDERGELLVRYGPPEKTDYDPLDVDLTSHVGDSRQRFAMNAMRWEWPRLGMKVVLEDRVLVGYWLLPHATDHDPDPRPDPDSLASLAAVGTNDDRGVFPALPPRTQVVRVSGQAACFAGTAGPRMFAALEIEGAPDDGLRAEAVVLDSLGHEAARFSRALAPSACAADRFRVADFAADLPAGDYVVGLSVRGGARRGTVRVPLHVPAPEATLDLSDVVVTCGTPVAPGPAVRLDPNPRARVRAGAPLSAYFEISNLALDASGQGRFEYDYRVRSDAKDARIWLQRLVSPRDRTPPVEASREEVNAGPLRRQFLRVPVESLPPGRYRLEIEVRDLLANRSARRVAVFEREAAR